MPKPDFKGGARRLFVDDEVPSAILSVIRDAGDHLVLVTPYIKLWRHAINALVLAINKGVSVTVIVRDQPDVVNGKDVADLLGIGVPVVAIQNLHTKVYMNEDLSCIGSMNLYEFSASNSHEVAIFVADEATDRQLRRYVEDTLLPLGRTLELVEDSAEGKDESGYCIRCRTVIGLEPDYPLCDGCYDTWAEWRNPDYEEDFCHRCGDEAEVSYGRPLCRDCYRTVA